MKDILNVFDTEHLEQLVTALYQIKEQGEILSSVYGYKPQNLFPELTSPIENMCRILKTRADCPIWLRKL